MELFRKGKRQPIKFRNFKFIDVAKNYPNVCYYYKELPRDNFELMTCTLEGTQRKLEIGAGTNVKIIDVFMAHYLYSKKHDIEFLDTYSFISAVIMSAFSDIKDTEKEAMIKKYNSTIPDEIKNIESYKKAKKDGYKMLYCSNDESKDRAFGIVNIVMYKDVAIDSKDERLDIHSKYTYFKPLRFMVSSSYLKGESKTKYREVQLEEIGVDHDLLA